jgi:hypothetical protein
MYLEMNESQNITSQNLCYEANTAINRGKFIATLILTKKKNFKKIS